MNLTKEQIKRGALGLIMVLLALYAYFTMMLQPLSTAEERAVKRMAELEPKMQAVRSQLNRTRAIEGGDANADYAEAIRKTIDERLPQEAAIVWLPQKTADLFRTNGAGDANVAFKGSQPDSELPGLLRSQWSIGVSAAGYHQLAESLASLENQMGLAQIQRVEISVIPAKPDQVNANILFSTVTRP